MIILSFPLMIKFTESGCGDLSPKTKGPFRFGEKSFHYDRIRRAVGVAVAYFKGTKSHRLSILKC